MCGPIAAISFDLSSFECNKRWIFVVFRVGRSALYKHKDHKLRSVLLGAMLHLQSYAFMLQ